MSDISPELQAIINGKPLDEEPQQLIRNASELELVGPPIEWTLYGYVPKAELTMVFGPGGIGKSSFGSWLCAKVSNEDKKFLFIGSEETPERFFGRVVLCGGKRSNCFEYLNSISFKLPKDADKLKKIIIDNKIDVVYIDSIYTHFESVTEQNAAEKARGSIAPLLSIAHETGASIVGVFHTNKAGEPNGSVEMRNVPRHVLKASRNANEKVLNLTIFKTNLRESNKRLRLGGKEMIFKDEDGNVQYEILEDGTKAPMNIFVPERLEEESGQSLTGLMIDDLVKDSRTKIQIIREEIEMHPEKTLKEICFDTGIDYASARQMVARMKKKEQPVQVGQPNLGVG